MTLILLSLPSRRFPAKHVHAGYIGTPYTHTPQPNIGKQVYYARSHSMSLCRPATPLQLGFFWPQYYFFGSSQSKPLTISP